MTMGILLPRALNLYEQLRGMIKKGLLLKYLKKKVPPGLVEKPWESERLTIKVNGERTSKDPGTSGSA